MPTIAELYLMNLEITSKNDDDDVDIHLPNGSFQAPGYLVAFANNLQKNH